MKAKSILSPCLLALLISLVVGVFHASGFHNPHLGRWINRDPIGELGFHLSARAHMDAAPHDGGNRGNLYAFVSNDPLSKIDAFGLIGTCICNFRIAPVFPPACDRFCTCISTSGIRFVSDRNYFPNCLLLCLGPNSYFPTK